jgi:hypothetical protein
MAPTASIPAQPGRPVIERASPTDRAFLAMGSGEIPEQFGVILLLDRTGVLDLARARRLIAERIAAVPRLRQRLIRAPCGCGGPVWVDDAQFDIRDHVRAVACGEPGDEPALLETAMSVIATPLRPAAPLWSAVLVTGLADGTVALVLVLHHALADGAAGSRSWRAWSTRGPARPTSASPGSRPRRPCSPGMRSGADGEGCAAAGSHGICCARPWAPGEACGRLGSRPVR